MEKRRQGRPKRGENEVGLSNILRSARDAMRSRSFDILSRKDLSMAVGVTPALISYYFPKGVDVADLVLSPVILGHFRNLKRTIDGPGCADLKLQIAYRGLIDAFAADKRLFDAYEALAIMSPHRGFTLVDEMRTALSELVDQCRILGASPSQTAVLHAAIWGMCKAAGEIEAALTQIRPGYQESQTTTANQRTHAAAPEFANCNRSATIDA